MSLSGLVESHRLWLDPKEEPYHNTIFVKIIKILTTSPSARLSMRRGELCVAPNKGRSTLIITYFTEIM